MAIGIQSAEKFTRPLRLSDLSLPASPPQSFAYVAMHEELESLLWGTGTDLQDPDVTFELLEG